MIYDYILSPHPRRLVFTQAGRPMVTLPVEPTLFGAILTLVEQEGEATCARLQDALRAALNPLQAGGDHA
jgi:hypothetical protein